MKHWTPPRRRGGDSARARLSGAYVAALLALVSCEPATSTAGPPTGKLAVRAVPLSLGPISEAVYRITVVNGASDVVWSREIASSQFGDAAGAISYVGPCDPTANPNRVELVVVSLADASGPLSFANPAPVDDPLVQLVDCQVQEDAAVTFEFTAAVAAKTGFFDVAISFDDIFCSAKFDCLTEDSAPLELLFNPLTGMREQTAVLGFACTAGPNQDTYLWMDPLEVVCDGGGPFDVNTAGGPGNLNPDFPGPLPDHERLLFQAAVYRGVELLDDATSWNKAYWNVALGLNVDSFAQLDTCTVHGLASASNGDFDIGQTPPNVRWPAVQFTVPLITAGALSCGRYELDAGPEVMTIYTGSDGHRFYASYRAATETLEIQVGTPDATTVVVCADATLMPGEQTLCVITPRQDGLLVPVQFTDFAGLSATAGTVSAVSPQELSTGFTFTFTAPATSQVVTIDTGVGATTQVVVLAVPDATSTLSCAATLLLSGDTTLCTIVPRQNGAPIHASASAFAPSPSPDGVTGPIHEAYGDHLTFTYTAGVTTGLMTLADGVGATTTLTVYGQPDATSTVACEEDRVLPGVETFCTITPRSGGVVILAASSGFDVTASPDGGIGTLNPLVGTAFHFIFTAPGTLGFKTLDIGFGTPESQTQVEVYSDVNIEQLDPPSQPFITSAGGQDGQIWLTWLPPSDNGGSPNLVYTVTCTPTAGGTGATTVTAALEDIVPGLQNGTPYTCVVYASNALGAGPPSDPTEVIIPQAVFQAAGLVVATPLTTYGQFAFDTNVGERVGVVLAEPAAFVVSASSDAGTVTFDALVARPLTVYAEQRYDGGFAFVFDPGHTTPVVAPPRTFLAANYADAFGHSATGAVTARELAVYGRPRYDDAGLTSALPIGAIGASPSVLTAYGFNGPFGSSASGAVVAPALNAYARAAYDDGGLVADTLVGVVDGLPAVFAAAGFDAVLGAHFSGAIVSEPLGVYAATTWDQPGLAADPRLGAVVATPGPFAADVATDLGAAAAGAIVAAPLAVYSTHAFFDPALSPLATTSPLAAAPAVFLDDPALLVPVVPDPLGPPTIIDATAGDGAIHLTWLAPAHDGGFPITSYTATCTALAPAHSASTTVATGDALVGGLMNGVAYTCVVLATNAEGPGPPSLPTVALVPGSAPTASGAVVAPPLGVYRADAFDAGDTHAVGPLLAPPATVLAAGYAAGLGQSATGAVVAEALAVYAADTFDGTRSGDPQPLGALVAVPGTWSVLADDAGATAQGAIVAVPLTVYAAARFDAPALDAPLRVSAIVAAPAVYNVLPNETADSRQSGAIVARPLAVYGPARYLDSTAGARVGAVVAPASVFFAGADGFGALQSGAVVALPFSVYSTHRYAAAASPTGAVVAPVAAFATGADGLGAPHAAALVARPLAAYGTERYQGAAATTTSALVARPAVFADDGTTPAATTLPTAPAITSASAGDGTIILTWAPPADNGGSPALIYTATCTADFGLHVVSLPTGDLGATLTGLHNGASYTCVVYASNTLGAGPPSDPVGPLTPLATVDRSGAVVARPLAVYRTATFLDTATPAHLGAIVAAPHTFSAAGTTSVLGAGASGAVVARPLAVYSAYSADSGATTAPRTTPLVALPAVFTATSQPDFGALTTGAIVAPPLNVYGATLYDAQDVVGAARVGVVMAAPGAFEVAGDLLGHSRSGAVVALPLTVFGAASYDAQSLVDAARVGVVVAAPGAWLGDASATELGQSKSGAVVAPPLAVVGAWSYDGLVLVDGARTSVVTATPSVWLGASFDGGLGAPRSGAVVATPLTAYGATTYDFQASVGVLRTSVIAAGPAVFESAAYADALGASLSGAVVARPLAVYGTARFDDPTLAPLAHTGALVAPPAVFLDDPALLVPVVPDPLGPPIIVAATAETGALRLAWVAPASDGGSPIASYTATCTRQSPTQSVSVTVTALDGLIGGLTNGVAYTCVVFATNANGDGPPSDPTVALVPGSTPTATGAVVARPVAVYPADRFETGFDAAVGPVLAPPTSFLAADYASALGRSASGAVVAQALAVYATTAFDGRRASDPQRTSAVVAHPAAWAVAPDSASVPAAGAVVAPPWAVYAAGSFDDTALHASLQVGAVVAAPSPYSVAPKETSTSSESGAVVAPPLAVYGASAFVDGAAAPRVGVTVAAPCAYTAGADALGALRSGAVVALPLSVYGAAAYLPSDTTARRVGAIVTPTAAFAADFASDLSVTHATGLVARPLAVYDAFRYATPATTTSALVGAPAVFADDGSGAGATTAPTAPTITTASAGDATITVAWLPPTDDGGSASLFYRATCSALFGLHVVTVQTSALTTPVPGLHNGSAYTCTVTALNGVGAGPASEPAGPLTPLGPIDGSGPVVAAPLAVYRAATYTAPAVPALTGAIVGAVHTFGAAQYEAGLGASASGTVVAVPLAVYSAFSFESAATSERRTGTVVAVPGTFEATLMPDFSGLQSGPVVALPLSVYGASLFDAQDLVEAAVASAVVAAPAVWAAGADGLGAQRTGAVAAIPLAVYAADRYLQPSPLAPVGTGVITAPPAAFNASGFASDLGLRASGAVVARALAVYAAARFDAPTLGAAPHAAPLVSAPAVFADLPGLLAPSTVPASAPVIVDALATSGAITLTWTAPVADGGSAVVGYTVTCTPVAGGATGSAATAALNVVVSGLTNGTRYACVVVATHAAGAGPPSAPSIALTPGPAPASSGAVLARPLTVGSLARYDDPTTTLAAIAGIASAPVAFNARFATDLGIAVTDAIVARTLAVYGTPRFDAGAVTHDLHLGAVVAPAAAFAVTLADALGDTFAGAVVARPLAIYPAERYDAPVVRDALLVGPTVAAPGVFAAGLADALGHSVTGAIVAATLAVTPRERCDDAGLTVAAASGPVVAVPSGWLSGYGDTLGRLNSGAFVAAALTVIGHPALAAVSPTTVSRAATNATLTLRGVGLDPASVVRFYPPASGTPSALVAAGAVTPGPDGTLLVPVTLDPAAPLGGWQVQVVTPSGYASPLNPQAAQQGLAVTLTLSE